MKKAAAFLLAGLFFLGLAGCTAPPPVRAADGADWSSDWVTVGGMIGVDTPDGLEPRENNEALAGNGMYYATWSAGEGEDYINEDGKDAQLYDAQVYLLLAGCTGLEKAEENAAEWLGLAQKRYVVEETGTLTCNAQTFTVITYTFDSAANPYTRGASAFGTYGNYAVSVELSCRDSFDGDPLETLTGFLDNCHYAA